MLNGQIQDSDIDYRRLDDDKRPIHTSQKVGFYSPQAPGDNADAINFEWQRQNRMRTVIEETVDRWMDRLKGSPIPAVRRVARVINREKAIANLFHIYSTKGKHWGDKAYQDWLVRIGWWLILFAQISEVGFSGSGVVLSALDADLAPGKFMFYYTLVLGGMSVGQLFPNWHGVNRETSIASIFCPANIYPLKFDIEDYGFSNRFHAEHFYYAANLLQDKDIQPWNWKSANSVLSYINTPTFWFTNWQGTTINAITFLFIRDLLFPFLSPTQKLVSGIVISIPFVIVGLLYYYLFGIKHITKANLELFSSENPVMQTARISPILAFQGILQWITNNLMRAVSISTGFMVFLTLLGLDLTDAPTFSLIVQIVSIFSGYWNTQIQRFSAFNICCEPFKFIDPLGQARIVPMEKYLEFGHAIGIAHDSITPKKKRESITKGLWYGGLTGTAVFLFSLSMLPPLMAAIPGGLTTLLLGLSAGLSKRKTDTQALAKRYINRACGLTEKKPNSRAQNLAIFTLICDSILRTTSKAGTIQELSFTPSLDIEFLKPLNSIPGLRELSPDSFALWLATVCISITPQMNEYEFYKLQTYGDIADMVVEVQQAAKESQQKGKYGCYRALAAIMPCFFKPEAEPAETKSAPAASAPATKEMTIFKRGREEEFSINTEIQKAAQTVNAEIAAEEAQSSWFNCCSVM